MPLCDGTEVIRDGCVVGGKGQACLIMPITRQQFLCSMHLRIKRTGCLAKLAKFAEDLAGKSCQIAIGATGLLPLQHQFVRSFPNAIRCMGKDMMKVAKHESQRIGATAPDVKILE